MTADIFEFWRLIGRGDRIHPADADVFARLGSEGHRFDHEALPASFMGPLRTASVVLLYMSPGLTAEDLVTAATPEGQDYYVRRWSGTEPLPAQGMSGGKWWRERTKCFSLEENLVASNVAVLNIGAYHSVQMNDPELLAALPSSRVSLDWAQKELFPQAERGERVVICLRAAKFWGLNSRVNYGGKLFAPPVNRGGHMLHGDVRNAVIDAVRFMLSQLQNCK